MKWLQYLASSPTTNARQWLLSVPYCRLLASCAPYGMVFNHTEGKCGWKKCWSKQEQGTSHALGEFSSLIWELNRWHSLVSPFYTNYWYSFYSNGLLHSLSYSLWRDEFILVCHVEDNQTTLQSRKTLRFFRIREKLAISPSEDSLLLQWQHGNHEGPRWSPLC